MPKLGLTPSIFSGLGVMALLLALGPARAYEPIDQLERWRQGPVPFSNSARHGPGTSEIFTSRPDLSRSRPLTLPPNINLTLNSANSQSDGPKNLLNGSTFQPVRAPLDSDAQSQRRALPSQTPIHKPLNRSWVDLNAAMELDSQTRGPRAKLIRLARPVTASISIAQNDTHSLELGGLVLNFHVANRKICRPVAHNQTRLILVGIKEGTTQLDVLVQSSQGEEPTVQRFEIEVRRLTVAKVSSLQRTAEVLELSIRSGFPTAQVAVTLVDGEIVVSGQCSDEQSARQILRLVRRTCSTPVWDRLLVR